MEKSRKYTFKVQTNKTTSKECELKKETFVKCSSPGLLDFFLNIEYQGHAGCIIHLIPNYLNEQYMPIESYHYLKGFFMINDDSFFEYLKHIAEELIDFDKALEERPYNNNEKFLNFANQFKEWFYRTIPSWYQQEFELNNNAVSAS